MSHPAPGASQSAEPLPLQVLRQGDQVPACIWRPPEARGIVLACHGGSGHKSAPAMITVARACVAAELALVAIDGPVHGERRADGNLDGGAAKADFRAAWRAGVGRTDMALDLSSALDAVERTPGLAGLPFGFCGVSMGTAYGLPLLAMDARIRAAAIGQWGLNYPASEHLEALARQVRCKVWFNQQLDDAIFDHAGTMALFRAIGSSDKRLVAYSGPHQELQGQPLNDAVAFLAAALKVSQAGSPVNA